MTTPDFEEWLMREDIPVEYTAEVEEYLDYLGAVYDFHDGTIEVARDVYAKKYDFLGKLDIKAVTRHYWVQGEAAVETRYIIEGERGLFGAERMYDIAVTRAEERMWHNVVEWLRERMRREGYE